MAITTAGKEKLGKITSPSSFMSIPGKGVKAVIDRQTIHIGTRNLMDELNVDTATYEDQIIKLEQEGKTVMLVSINGKLVGILAVADTVKDNSAEAINNLKKMGITIYMMTGDNQRTAKAIADLVGITNILAEILPEQKAAEVDKLKAAGKKLQWLETVSTMPQRLPLQISESHWEREPMWHLSHLILHS